MLKGHVFSKQIFGNPIFALFINTFLNGKNGVSNNYKNGMQITYSGTNVTVNSGAVCIQGRFLEEDTYTTILAGTDNSYCKLVIEIDLNKENTESNFTQGSYKIVKSASGYPNLTQSNIVKNVSGVYQYELARFKTSPSGITDFQDMRTFLDFDSIYDAIEEEYQVVLNQLQEKLENVVDGSDYWLKASQLTNQNLNDYTSEGFYYAAGGNTITNKPNGVDHFGVMVKRIATGLYKQILDNNEERWTRYYGGGTWSEWVKDVKETNFKVLEGTITTPTANSGSITAQKDIAYPTGFNYSNCVPISYMANANGNFGWATYTPADSIGYLLGSGGLRVLLKSNTITVVKDKSDDTEPSTTVNYRIVLMKIS